MSTADANPEYWGEYSNLQQVKHDLIRNYLNGWFPKMVLGPTGCGRLLYIDTHAGRGKHLNGQLGSPLVALTTLLDHESRETLLQKAEVRFLFVERDAENVEALKQELAARPLPPKIVVEPEHGDSFRIIEDAIKSFEKEGKQLDSGFIFVDPYGFKLPGHLLRKLLSYPKVELFVNVIWRELDMAIQQVRGDAKPRPVEEATTLFDGEGVAEQSEVIAQRRADTKLRFEQILNRVFDGDGWRKIDGDDSDTRADQCADLFRKMTGAKWGTYIRMLDKGRIRYFLLHLTKSDAGRDLMKECIWMSCPQGGFYASRADNPRQVVLVEPKSLSDKGVRGR